MQKIIEEARHFLTKFTPAISGKGGDRHTFWVTLKLLQKFNLTENDALTAIQHWNQRCVPPWSTTELIHKLRSAANVRLLNKPRNFESKIASQFCGQHKGTVIPTKSTFRLMVLKRIAAKLVGVSNIKNLLRKLSPISIDEISSADFLQLLYPPGKNEKILIFSIMQSQGQLLWSAECPVPECNFPSGPDGVWFLPQPITGEYSPNPRSGGKTSRRSEEAVSSWRYAVLESDVANSDDWLRCLIQLPLQISSICESGGRSVHALIRIDAKSKTDWDGKMRIIKPTLITLGADPNALTAIRLTRLPQAMRGEYKQSLLYLNPNPTNTPIFSTLISLKGSL